MKIDKTVRCNVEVDGVEEVIDALDRVSYHIERARELLERSHEVELRIEVAGDEDED